MDYSPAPKRKDTEIKISTRVLSYCMTRTKKSECKTREKESENHEFLTFN